ncbi:uncharacterized protein A1O5_12803 [Cladophialophora psammophila CBS 110553]|uniref:Uncharacterized protein n=1 Tax=Cladophialophora psammophila CBS 110553 TaxID=1182543 RepID=W9W929_9EURO|nr:uncharacterized protein A1O5_12803 [Cladophialophora psammophila CBS 110553]EXJ55064.1 hypothetical protein A1O5_12803 [Cladophialophora psammophila CBS 110553]
MTEENGNYMLPDLWEDTVKPGTTIMLNLVSTDEAQNAGTTMEPSQKDPPQADYPTMLSSIVLASANKSYKTNPNQEQSDARWVSEQGPEH